MQSLATPRTLFVGAVVLFAAWPVVRSSSKAPVATTDPILSIHTDSLTTYLHASATGAQDIRPRASERGTNLEGTFRGSPSQLMRIHGNPFENVWSAPGLNGMRLDTGAWAVQDVDIALPAEGFPWVIGRTYNARQETSGSAHRDSDGPQGKNWFQSSMPEIQLFEHGSDASKDVLYLVYGADRFAEYKRTGASSDLFKGVNGAAGVFEFQEDTDAGDPDTYELTDQHGNSLVFLGFDADSSPAEGQIWKITDPKSNTAYVGSTSSASAALSAGYDSTTGFITKAYDATGRRFTYAYTTLDSVERLTEVKAESFNGSTWDLVEKVGYEYYTSESYGDPGDLKLVEITTPLTDSGVESVRKKYYRYWEGTFNDSTNPGHPHALKYVVDFEGTRRQDWADELFDEDFLSASNSSLESYATAYFEYDSSHRIDKAWFNGECGCSGGINGTHEFEYETNGSFTDNTSIYQVGWKTRTIVQRPDTSYMTQYWDEAHQALSQVITDADPDNTSPVPDRWATRVTRSSAGVVNKIFTPECTNSYTHSSGTIVSELQSGHIWVFDRETTGAMTSFVTARRFQLGSSGNNQWYEREWEYTQADLEIGTSTNVYVSRPMIDKIHDYDVKSTSTTDRITTDRTPVVASSTLAMDTDMRTDPAVATSENGENVGYQAMPYYRLDGTTAFEESPHASTATGIITYREYVDGRLAKVIEDADTSETADFDMSVPSGLSSSTGAIHRETSYDYDAQGRQELVTQPDGRKLKSYYSKLADGRLVTLTYNDYETSPSTKFYGPVSFQIRNHAGQVEAQGTVALTSNESTSALTAHVDETDDDPITALDLGTVARLSTTVFDETGTMAEESRLYFDIPASGDGIDGTHFDPTVLGYDDMGRQTRTKAPHGTIQRTSFDALGRVTARWTGTNDSTFSGGESSGTDNMVKVEELEYDDGNDDENSLLTKRTLFVEDSTTDKRETTYKYDRHGRLLLETRPVGPHPFYKLDNRGRTIATGLFSSTASINANADDPTTETTNRVALTQSYYDDRGQVWKTTRHEIDASDGSDDDNLEHLFWYDDEGQVIKEDGPELTKTIYDRLGRATHRFLLATDDDTEYDDVSDVVGDWVLEEHQSVYDDTSDELLMQVALLRHHDASTGTGALDSGADNDALLVTAANLNNARPQIMAYWYDRFGRQEDVVAYGTYGGSNFDRDGLNVPARSDTALRTSYS